MDESVLPTQVARAIAAQRRRIHGACAACGNGFEGLKQRKYCSAACRQRAHTWRTGRRAKSMAEIPALVARLDATRAAIMRGRSFDTDSAELIRESRKQRSAEL